MRGFFGYYNHEIKKMKTNLFIIIIFFSIKGFSQGFELRKTPFIKSEIILKDGSTKEGLLRLASSALSLRFKTTKKDKEEKINYKKVERIITNPNTENQRVFQYLHHNYNKFLIFSELLYTDGISVYCSSKGISLFYSDYNRETIEERYSQHNQNIEEQYIQHNQKTDYSPTPNHILIKENSVLLKIEKNKRFLKKSKKYIRHCPILLKDMEQGKITLKDLPTFIKYYKVLSHKLCKFQKTQD